MKPTNPITSLDPKDRLDSALHDLTNALAAARSFGDVLALRAKSGSPEKNLSLIESLLREIDRANEIVQNVRRETYRAGDTLTCRACGYTFVNRRSSGKPASCRRCKGKDVVRWKPTE